MGIQVRATSLNLLSLLNTGIVRGGRAVVGDGDGDGADEGRSEAAVVVEAGAAVGPARRVVASRKVADWLIGPAARRQHRRQSGRRARRY